MLGTPSALEEILELLEELVTLDLPNVHDLCVASRMLSGLLKMPRSAGVRIVDEMGHEAGELPNRTTARSPLRV